jgi:hypothetical protein
VTPSPEWFVPFVVPGGNPVIAVVEPKDPMSPLITLGPVFVIPAPARTAKLVAVRRLTVGGPLAIAALPAMAPIAMTNAMPTIATIAFEFFMLVAPLHAPVCGVSVCFGWSTDWPSVS